MNEENHSRDNVWQWGSFVRLNHESLKIKLHVVPQFSIKFVELVFADIDNQEIHTCSKGVSGERGWLGCP